MCHSEDPEQPNKQKSSPKFIGLQVELNDLTHEKSLEQCPVPNHVLNGRLHHYYHISIIIIIIISEAGRVRANSPAALDGFVVNCSPLR